jgi:hypothetical protein
MAQSKSAKNREAMLYYLGTHAMGHYVSDIVPYLQSLGIEPMEQALTIKLVEAGRVELVPGMPRTYRLAPFAMPH